MLIDDLEKSWSDLVGLYVPVSTSNDRFWRYSHETMRGLPRQGWKIHVSATIVSACDILRLAGPILQKSGAIFKTVNKISNLKQLNCGLYFGYSQIGKFLTVYPSTPCAAVSLARQLSEALSGQPAPSIPFEIRVDNRSPVFVRYGLFRSEGAIENPDGGFEDDRRDINPPWAMLPAGLMADRHPDQAGPLSQTYRAYGFISQRGKGGVYRAIDISAIPIRHCILKEGRRFGELDLDGHDGYSRVSQEVETLTELAACNVPVPQLFSTFDQAGHKYIVLDWMPNGSLAEYLSSTERQNITMKESLDLCLQACRVVAQIHACNWIWRDLKCTNFLVDSNGRLRPIDFEGAARRGSLVSSPWGSPGHVPPEWETTSIASRSQDEYALGVLLKQILTRNFGSTGKETTWEIPDAIEQVIAALTHERPDMRPHADLVAGIIESSIARS